MNKLMAVWLLLLPPFITAAQQTASDLITAAIKFHDPHNNWPKTQLNFYFSDTRPGKEPRASVMYLDNSRGTVCITREQDGRAITRHVVGEACKYDIDGNYSPSAEDAEQFALNDKRSLMLRNYYLYLWGLPMKLADPGTIIDPKIYKKEFNGQETLVARVTYEQEIGKDTWYFYFDPTTSEMVGYRFYHDENKGDGEYIVLKGLEKVNGMKIPKQRTWYTNPDSTLLGTDNLISTLPFDHKH